MGKFPPLLSFLIITFISTKSSIKTSSPTYIRVSCSNNCNVRNGQINGGENEDIALKYFINTTEFVTMDISYDGRRFMYVIPSSRKVIVVDRDRPHFVNATGTELRKREAGFEFSFSLLKLNRSSQGKEFTHHVLFNSGM